MIPYIKVPLAMNTIAINSSKRLCSSVLIEVFGGRQLSL